MILRPDRASFGRAVVVGMIVFGVAPDSSGQEAGCTPPPLCCEDVTGYGEDLPDGVVGVQDFLAVLVNWGMGGASRPVGDIAPFSCDGCATGGDFMVGVDDFLAVLGAWGPCDVPIDRCEDVLDPGNTFGRISADGVYPFRINGVLDGPPRPSGNFNCDFFPCDTCGFAFYGIDSILGQFRHGDSFGIRADTGDIGGDVWFTYMAPCSGLATFDTSPLNCSLDGLVNTNIIEVYSGGQCPTDWLDRIKCGELNATLCPDSEGPHGALEIPVIEGEEYLVRIGGWFTAPRGDGTLTVRCVDNSSCADAIALDIGQEITMTTVGASMSVSPPCAGVTHDTPGRWFTVVGGGRELTATTCFNETRDGFYDTRISVFQGTDGSCGALECVTATDENSCQLQESVTWCADEGRRYFILVHGNADLLPPFATAGEFTLEINDGAFCADGLTGDP